MRHFNQRGVTLLELLVAMMLLATALVGLAASFPLLMQTTTITTQVDFQGTTGGLQTVIATILSQ